MGLFASSEKDQGGQLRRIEAKLDLILKHLGLKFEGPQLSSRVMQLASSGNKIEACKVHCEETGASLSEAKSAVENYLSQVR